MQINDGGGQSRMAHQQLYFSDVLPGFEKVRGKGMAQRMGRRTVGKAERADQRGDPRRISGGAQPPDRVLPDDGIVVLRRGRAVIFDRNSQHPVRFRRLGAVDTR